MDFCIIKAKMDIKRIGATIAYLRKKAGFTQKDLADRIGISDKAVSRWERGLGMPDISYLRKLAILLDTSTDNILAGDTIHHAQSWQGILIFKENTEGINARTVIYDKPLATYLLSYFLLLGIRNILIICEEHDRQFITGVYSSGESLGAEFKFSLSLKEALKDNLLSKNNYLLVYGKSILYGVDQTRFFQNAMTNTDGLTILALPKKGKRLTVKLCVNKDKRLVSPGERDVIHTQYDYSAIPILFCTNAYLKELAEVENVEMFISQYSREKKLYVEMLDRGFVELPIDSWDEVNEASTFIRIVQDKCGMNIYCIEEVAWRRGLISADQLRALGEKRKESDYGRYILSLFPDTIWK